MREKILTEISNERDRQTNKWGEQHRRLGVDEEVWGEIATLAKESCDKAEIDSKSDDVNLKAAWFDILLEEVAEVGAEPETELKKIRNELIQVAAVAVAIIEDIDQNY